MSGSLLRNPSGLEWKTDFNIENPPNGATPEKLIRSIATKIHYTSTAPSSSQPGKRPATVEMTFIHGDSQERRTTSMHLLSGATVEPSLEELVNSVTNSVVNLPFPKYQRASQRRLTNPRGNSTCSEPARRRTGPCRHTVSLAALGLVIPVPVADATLGPVGNSVCGTVQGAPHNRAPWVGSATRPPGHPPRYGQSRPAVWLRR